MTDADKIEAWNLIERLRAEEGHAVTINCGNPEPPPNAAIDVVGDWTDWEEKRFPGDSVLQCLHDAVAAMEATPA